MMDTKRTIFSLSEWSPNTEIFSGPYFLAFGLNMEIPYSVQIRENTDKKKLHIWTLFTQCFPKVHQT